MLGMRVVHNNMYTDPLALLEMVVSQSVTIAAAVPTVWQTVRGALEADPAKYKGKFNMKQIVCGGSSPPNEMMRYYYDEFQVEFVQAWGMTVHTLLLHYYILTTLLSSYDCTVLMLFFHCT
jgi:fatty-acyl-CoA synthase